MPMSVAPWTLGSPRSAFTPPPGMPMLPSSNCITRHSARVLGAIGVLGLAERVQHGAGLTGLGGRGIGFVDEFENILVHTADTANGVERVTGIVLLELLVDAHGVLQRHVLLGVSERRRSELRGAGLVNPGVRAVLSWCPSPRWTRSRNASCGRCTSWSSRSNR